MQLSGLPKCKVNTKKTVSKLRMQSLYTTARQLKHIIFAVSH